MDTRRIQAFIILRFGPQLIEDPKDPESQFTGRTERTVGANGDPGTVKVRTSGSICWEYLLLSGRKGALPGEFDKWFL